MKRHAIPVFLLLGLLSACGAEDKDSDGDGIKDSRDNCVKIENPDQADLDNDRLGDACDDDWDGDNVPNGVDLFPRNGDESADADEDGIGDNSDLAPNNGDRYYALVSRLLEHDYFSHTFTGTTGFDQMGLNRKAAALGDLNGDGITDLGFVLPDEGEYVGSPSVIWDGTLAVYIVLGSPNMARDWTLDTIRQNAAFKITDDRPWRGGNYFDEVLQLFSSGDVNGDGYDDFVLKTGWINATTHLIYGAAQWPDSEISLQDLPGDYALSSISQDYVFQQFEAFHPLGDINNDGHPDLLFGFRHMVPYTPELGHVLRPRIWLGDGTTLKGELSLEEVSDEGALYPVYFDVLLNGEHFSTIQLKDSTRTEDLLWSTLGVHVSAIGNFNGDAYDDFVLHDQPSERYYENSFGHVYVIYGGPTEQWQQDLDLATLSKDRGLDIRGEASVLNGPIENSINAANLVSGRDLNDDGLNDVFLATSFWGGFKSFNTLPRGGVGFFIYGKAGGYSDAEYALTDWLQQTPHFKQEHMPIKSNGVVLLDDINGDHLPEIAMSRFFYADFEDGLMTDIKAEGAMQILLGSKDFPNVIDVSDMSDGKGYFIYNDLFDASLKEEYQDDWFSRELFLMRGWGADQTLMITVPYMGDEVYGDTSLVKAGHGKIYLMPMEKPLYE